MDFAEDYAPIKAFFGGEQIEIWNRAIRLMKIYEESKTFIVNREIETVVAEVNSIMRKDKPFGEIRKLPELLERYINLYSKMLMAMEEPILAVIEESRARVFDELHGKNCEDQIRQKVIDRFNEIKDKATHCNNVATLQNIKVEADALKVRLLNEISDAEAKIIAKKQAEEQTKADEQSGTAATTPVAPPAPKQKKQKTVSIKSINTEATWRIETAHDGDNYV